MLQTYSNLEHDRANFRQNRKTRRADKKNKRAQADLQHSLPEFKEPELAFIKEGRVKTTGNQAGLILEKCSYKGQTRHETLNGRKHIDVLVMQMERGQWRRGDAINFALYNGDYILLDGHHRFAANIKYECSIEWSFVIHECETWEQVAELYSSFNRNVRGRIETDILNARSIPEEFGISLRTARAAFRAAPLLASGFDFVAAFFDPNFTKDDELRIQMMRYYAKEIVAWDRITTQRGINGEHKRKLGTQGALSVALVTLASSPEIAYRFWNEVATISGERGTASHTYALMLTRSGDEKEAGTVTNTTSGQARETARLAAHAWGRYNKHGEGKSFADRQKDKDLEVFGTPFFVPGIVDKEVSR